jgi:lysozyme
VAEFCAGLDVSHHQTAGAIRWDLLAESHRFIVARGCYGTKADATFGQHVRRAQAVGMVCGAYLFFRPTQDVDEQLATFESVTSAVGMGPSWLVPALDVERNEKFDGHFTASRYSARCRAIAERLRDRYGGCLVYTNPSDWQALGSPAWIREHMLWIAHYTSAAQPLTPHAMPWRIWQHRVAPLAGIYPRDIDQNTARLPLPLIAAPLPETLPAPVLLPLERDIDAERWDRDRDIAERDDPEDT